MCSHWHICSITTLTACTLRAKVGLRVVWTLIIIPFALNHHMLRVHPRRLELSMSTMRTRLCNKPCIHVYMNDEMKAYRTLMLAPDFSQMSRIDCPRSPMTNPATSSVTCSAIKLCT